MKARDIKIGTKYDTGRGSIQEVTRIVKISAKTIEFRTNRISPDYYEGNFFQRKSLDTIIKEVR